MKRRLALRIAPAQMIASVQMIVAVRMIMPAMTKVLLASMIFLASFLSMGGFVSKAAESGTDVLADEYVCPPCPCGNDGKVYDKEGFCPVCGMKLVLKSTLTVSAAPRSQRAPARKVAILIFDNVQIIDYTGPYEVFGAAGMDVFTVATSTAQIKTNLGMKVTPDYALNEAPEADVLLIPGGGVFAMQQDQQVLQWIRERAKAAEYIVSVCNGASILAKTGLLDGLTATTTAGLIDGFSTIAPKVKVVHDQRYVDNGKFITTAGLSSGIDGALYVVSKLFGKAQAQTAALRLEYDWKGDSKYARANLADRFIMLALGRAMVLPAPEGAQTELLSTQGTAQNWEVKWQVIGEAAPAEVLKLLNDKLSAANWVEQKNPTRSALKHAWKFNDQESGNWNATADTQSAGSKITIVSLNIEHVGAIGVAEPNTDKLIVHNAWIQEMPPSKRLTAAHLVIENLSGKENALIGASAGIARAVELHRAEMNNGMMRMQKLDRIPLPIGKTDLTGELHIMLIDLKAPLKEGDQVMLTLEFENAASKTVIAPVKKRQAE
jgi:copper(I)-binding protein/putative intracellular protease/amidase